MNAPPDLFELLPPALFRPLGGPNARIYFGVLAALYMEKFEGAPAELPRQVAINLAEDVLRGSAEWKERAQDVAASVAEGEDDGPAEYQDADELARSTASRLLSRLERTGWFRFEYYPEAGEVLNFHANPARVLGLLLSIARDERPIISGFVHSIASALRDDLFEARPGLRLEQASREMAAFAREIRILHGTIQESHEKITTTEMPVAEMVEETVHRYGERVRKSYNNLKTVENIYSWRAHIQARLSSIGEQRSLLESAAREMGEIHGVPTDEARDMVEERLDLMHSHIDVMPALVASIDERNARYSSLAARRVQYLVRQNASFEAQLQCLIDALGTQRLRSLDLPLYRQQHLSPESWYRPRKYTIRPKNQQLLPPEDIADEVLERQMKSILGKKYRPERVAEWASNLLGARTRIHLRDTSVSGDEDYIYMIHLFHYAETRKIPFSIVSDRCATPGCPGCPACRVRCGLYGFPSATILREGA